MEDRLQAVAAGADRVGVARAEGRRQGGIAGQRTACRRGGAWGCRRSPLSGNEESRDVAGEGLVANVAPPHIFSLRGGAGLHFLHNLVMLMHFHLFQIHQSLVLPKCLGHYVLLCYPFRERLTQHIR